MERHVEPDQSYFTAVHTAIENVELDGERVLRVLTNRMKTPMRSLLGAIFITGSSK